MSREIWALFCEIGFWGWVLGFCGFLSFSFPARNTLKGRAAVPWGLAFLLFYSLWIAGMMQA